MELPAQKKQKKIQQTKNSTRKRKVIEKGTKYIGEVLGDGKPQYMIYFNAKTQRPQREEINHRGHREHRERKRIGMKDRENAIS